MAKGLGKLKEQIKELGFGSKGFSNRLIDENGNFNVERKGVGIFEFSLYHWLINMHWLIFFFCIVILYILINLVFATFYYKAGVEGLTEFDSSGSGYDAFLYCFYFSSQTLTTVGFGKISPDSHLTSIIASFEAMIGLLGFALATGILYGRFSKAKAKIKFSENAVIGPFKDHKGLKFRISNARKNQLIELKARVMYSFLDHNGGAVKRQYKQLDLEIDFINMFPLPWTLVHPINESSPLYKKGTQDLMKEEAEFLIILKGYDDTFSQYVHQVNSYKHDELVFDAEFEQMFKENSDGKTIVYLNKISNFRKKY